MRRVPHLIFIPLALLLLVAPLKTLMPAWAADSVTLQGSTTFVSRLMDPFKREIEMRSGATLTVVGNKSLNGLTALLEKRAMLAMISAPLETELILMRRQFPDMTYDTLESFEIARTSVAFVTHPDNTVRTLKLDDIRRILNGHVVNWSAFGGPDQAIKPVFVKEGGGVTLSVQTHLLAGQIVPAAAAARVDTPRQVLKVVMQEPGALGITQQILAAQSGLPRVETDGVIEQTLNLVSLGPPSAAARRVIEAARAVASERLF
jgi:phosphate transport system substrate-binding protein